MAERKLTERQKEFCRLCAAGMKPLDAAKLLGYRNISRTVGDMLRMEKIQKEIQRRKEKTPEKAEKTMSKEEETAVAEKEEILCFLTEMMREDDDPKMRMKAAQLLGKRESLFAKEKKAEEKSPIFIVDDLP